MPKATTDSKRNRVTAGRRDHDSGYFHLRAQACTQKHEAGETSGWCRMAWTMTTPTA
jgi:hypothetical protein